MNCKKTQKVDAVVTDITSGKAIIQVESPKQQSCQHCQTQGGCRSVSIYQLLFANLPIYIDNNNYHIGEQLELQFSNNLIMQAIWLLLGLPLIAFIIGVFIANPVHELLGFLLGIILTVVTVYFSKNYLVKNISQKISIVKSH